MTKRGEFQKVMSGGRRCARRFLVLCAAPRESTDLPTRLGLTVSGKVGGSVVRNRVKRRLREIFRRRHASLPPGWDLVLIARPGSADAPSAAFATEFDSCARVLLAAPRPPSSSPPGPSGEPC